MTFYDRNHLFGKNVLDVNLSIIKGVFKTNTQATTRGQQRCFGFTFGECLGRVSGVFCLDMYVDQPAMISVTDPTPQWAQLKSFLLETDRNHSNILKHCDNSIIKYKCK